jgi:glucosamine--fructose-6-phosphate aminotransferase (isomerizing)
VIAICNTNGSTIPRESDAALYTHAGPEIAVASTKAFLAQITACYLLGLYLAQLRGNKFPDEVREILGQLHAMPDKIAEGARRPRAGAADGRADGRRPARCCSSAGTSASRSRWRARSSSRSSRTSTPRASPPASSSTGRSR